MIVTFDIYRDPFSNTYTSVPHGASSLEGWILECETSDEEYLTHPEYLPDGAVVV